MTELKPTQEELDELGMTAEQAAKMPYKQFKSTLIYRRKSKAEIVRMEALQYKPLHQEPPDPGAEEHCPGCTL